MSNSETLSNSTDLSVSEPSAVNSAQTKLQAFVNSLTPDEAQVVDLLMQRAADESVAAEVARPSWDTGEETSIIIVGGRGATWHRIALTPLRPGDLVELNPQPLPPEPPPEVRPGG